MKKELFVVMLLVCFCCVGCDNFLAGFGTGAAGQETLKSWKANLEERKAILEQQYEAAFAELQSAPDPNTVALAKQKVEEIQRAQVANTAALLTVDTMLKLPEASGEGGRTDVVVSSLIGASIIALREWQKRNLADKYVAMKAGKAAFEAADPKAGKKLHTAIGIERTNRGL